MQQELWNFTWDLTKLLLTKTVLHEKKVISLTASRTRFFFYIDKTQSGCIYLDFRGKDLLDGYIFGIYRHVSYMSFIHFVFHLLLFKWVYSCFRKNVYISYFNMCSCLWINVFQSPCAYNHHHIVVTDTNITDDDPATLQDQSNIVCDVMYDKYKSFRYLIFLFLLLFVGVLFLFILFLSRFPPNRFTCKGMSNGWFVFFIDMNSTHFLFFRSPLYLSVIVCLIQLVPRVTHQLWAMVLHPNHRKKSLYW